MWQVQPAQALKNVVNFTLYTNVTIGEGRINEIALSGLGKMGGQIAKMLHDGGHEVVAHNPVRKGR